MLFPILTVICGCSGKSEPTDSSLVLDSADRDTATQMNWSIAREEAPEGAFLSAWGASSDDIWIVGGQEDSGVVLRGSQSEWASQVLPENTPLLNWVHGTSATDIWVGGLSGTLLHWNGSDWTDHSIEIEEAFWGIYANSPSDVVAVGGESRWGGTQGKVYRYDGTEWTSQQLPTELGEVSNLFKVTHDGSQYWVVGVSGTAMKGDGTTFEAIPTGTTTDLITVHHSGRTQIVGGRGTGVVIDIENASLVPAVQAVAGLNGVHVIDESTSFVVGERGYGAFYGNETFEEVPSITLDVLHGTFADNDGTIYAVGGNLFTSEPTFHGTVLYLNNP